jgi:hypothetical protein
LYTNLTSSTAGFSVDLPTPSSTTGFSVDPPTPSASVDVASQMTAMYWSFLTKLSWCVISMRRLILLTTIGLLTGGNLYVTDPILELTSYTRVSMMNNFYFM